MTQPAPLAAEGPQYLAIRDKLFDMAQIYGRLSANDPQNLLLLAQYRGVKRAQAANERARAAALGNDAAAFDAAQGEIALVLSPGSTTPPSPAGWGAARA